jgi:[protein-PII] uridylyltransferase
MAPEQKLQELAQRRLKHVAQLEKAMAGSDWCAQHTGIVDDVVKLAYETVREAGDAGEIAIIANGGYGRQELAPHSDVDLTVVPLDEAEPANDRFVRDLYRHLNDYIHGSLGLQLGYSYRLVADTPGLDAESRTALLDARLVGGSSAAYKALMSAFWDTFPHGEFILDKIEERRVAFVKYGDTPLVVEPHLKEGAGGLRSFHCANWIGAAIGDRPRRPSKAYEKVLAFRNAAHYTAGKAADRLTRQRQAALADLYGEQILAELPDLAAAMSALHDEYRIAIASLHEARFRISQGVMALRGEARVVATATLSQAAVGMALATKLGLRVPELPTAVRLEVDGAEATFALTSGEATVRNLERSGLLDALLPELAACKILLPSDAAHTYTVYEHTLRAIRNLDNLEPNGFLGQIKNSLRSAEPLHLALLLHDVGKARKGKPHSETGEEMVHEIARRWHLNESIEKSVAWLVKDHLLMSNFIRLRDVLNPATAEELASAVQSRERLDWLTLLTWADVNAVGPDIWTPAQEALLEELYRRTAQVLEQGQAQPADTAGYRRRVMREMRQEEASEEDVRVFLDSLPAQYLASTPPEVIQLHLRLARRAAEGEPSVTLRDMPSVGTTEVTVCSLDEPALLSRILGVIYAFDLTVHGLRASTTAAPKPVAVDVFSVSFGKRTIPMATGERFVEALQAVLKHENSVEELLTKAGKDAFRAQEIFTYKFVAGEPAILEVQAPRGRGMAYRFSRLIASHGWNITAARVGQWAGRGSAAFYVEGATAEEMAEALQV